jgi:tRNA 2-thiouridine synthesizing protein A
MTINNTKTAGSLLDTLGLRCPQPVLKLAVKAVYMRPGEILEVRGDCSTFEKDIRTWCDRLNKPLLAVINEEKGRTRMQIQF